MADRSRELTLPGSMLVRGAAMIQDVFWALWFITLLIVVYGMATGDLWMID
jgi:hypothetical protein